MLHDASAITSPSSSTGRDSVSRRAAIAFRPVSLWDLRQVAALQRRAFKPRLAYGLGTLLVLWMLPRERFVVATAGDDIIGCAIDDVHGGNSRIVNICVDPDWQNQGIGGRLLTALESHLPIGNMVLMVERSNEHARHLYAKCGYEEQAIARNYYGSGFDGVWMQKRRTPGPDLKIRV